MENMTYEKFINNILETRGRRGCFDAYHETHHILPKCCGGSDNQENLVDLYAAEHFIAHRLLAIENPHNDRLVYAWWNMSGCICKDGTNRYQCTPEEYEEARIAFVKSISGENNPMYGKHHAVETRRKMQYAKNGKYNGENNPMYSKCHSKETREKISKSRIGQRDSDETKRKKSESKLGKKHHKSKMVFCIELDQYFGSAREAERILGIQQSGISRCCNGQQKYAGKHSVTGQELHWIYADNINDSFVA